MDPRLEGGLDPRLDPRLSDRPRGCRGPTQAARGWLWDVCQQQNRQVV